MVMLLSAKYALPSHVQVMVAPWLTSTKRSSAIPTRKVGIIRIAHIGVNDTRAQCVKSKGNEHRNV